MGTLQVSALPTLTAGYGVRHACGAAWMQAAASGRLGQGAGGLGEYFEGEGVW